MASLASNALVTYEELIEYLGDSADAASVTESRGNMLINMASEMIENHTRRKWISGTDTHIFRGHNSSEYHARYWPISGTPTIYWHDGDDWEEASSASYPTDQIDDEGLITFTRGHKFWTSSYRKNWKVVYTYGYARGSVPYDLKQACLTLVHRMLLKANRKEGVQSESFGDQTTTYNLAQIPEDVKTILNPYVSHRQYG